MIVFACARLDCAHLLQLQRDLCQIEVGRLVTCIVLDPDDDPNMVSLQTTLQDFVEIFWRSVEEDGFLSDRWKAVLQKLE